MLAGHRRRHARLFEARLLSQWQRPLGPLQIAVFPEWGRQLLSLFAPELDPVPFRLLHTPETLYLMRRFYQEHGHDYWGSHQADGRFFQHLLRRHWRCAENGLRGAELDQLTAAHEISPLAPQANAFLEAFEIWLQGLRPRLLSVAGQMRALENLAELPALHAHAAQWTHWLMDDLDETRPVEQGFYRALSRQATLCVMAANPQGGVERLLGAYPEYVQTLQETPQIHVQHLLSQGPQQVLADTISQILLHQPLPEGRPLPACQVLRYQHPTQMIEALGEAVAGRLREGLPGHEMVCVSWNLSELSSRQLLAHFRQRGIEVDLFRGNETLQRQPVINTLLSLLRLVLWEQLRLDARIPRLTGFDMVQIYRLCAGLDAFELSSLRLRYGDQLEAWGHFLRERAPHVLALQRLQQAVAQAREQYGTPALPHLAALARFLWEQLLLPVLSDSTLLGETDFERHTAWRAVQQFLGLLERHLPVQEALQDPAADAELMLQLLEEDMLEESSLPPQLQNGRPKIMTLYRLCELRYQAQQQFWFDLTSSGWVQPVNHPLDNALLLSRSWPTGQDWSLDAEDRFIEERLASLVRKGLQYGRQRPIGFACRYDHLAQAQSFERLARTFALGARPELPHDFTPEPAIG
ncbi:MAG: hypothetical protein ACO1RX_06225 [Candidatus Sericytochromatia bacterium]